MSLERSQQPTANVMSIDAITSSYCCSSQLDSKSTAVISRQNLIDAALYKQEEYQPLPPMSEISPPSWCEPNEWYRSKEMAVGHWIKSSNQELGFIHTAPPTHPSSDRVPLMSSGTIAISSPSYSTSSSEHEFDYKYSSSSPRYQHSRHRTNSTLISKDTIDSLNSEKKSRSSFDYNEGHCRNNVGDRKSNAIANRRARNKLASAKYRAKKQALTHAMQDRIMQLATQVMNLRNELNQTKHNETELLGKYERLVKYFQNDKSMHPSVSLKENAVDNPQYNLI
jgi:hypothetical protein